MERKRIPHLLTIVFITLSIFGLVRSAVAQTPTPPTRDKLIDQIEELAHRDAEADNPPERIADLAVLFSDDAKIVGLSMTEVLSIYERVYKTELSQKPWWTRLKPQVGWIVATAFFLLLILRDVLQKRLTSIIEWIIYQGYLRLAGYQPFWNFALSKYRSAIIGQYQEIKIPFRPGRPLKMKEVYVPLKATWGNKTNLIDIHDSLAVCNKIMVIGAPGAGKTMLVKRIALDSAQKVRAHFGSELIPIVVELNQLNSPDLSIINHLVKILNINDFPNAEKFVQTGLEHGILLLLLDGLDEVNAGERPRVTQEIKELGSKYKECKVIVTCRTAVYNEELTLWSDQKLEIVEFDDQQIQLFLNSWREDMPADKSVEHFLRNLRERPRIMALARNPLLLTIITYLYTDTAFVLPHSRAEFYSKAITVLLDQWHTERNRYKSAHKKIILQHLALFNQDYSNNENLDRRSINLFTILKEIKAILPSLALQDNDAQPILDEIVERSGLLLSLDGGVKYQFTHLTLQEFFAALALETEEDTLLKRYMSDKETWRESVKLWCGLDHNSTDFLRSLYSGDRIVTFECMSDAQQVDTDFATEIIGNFKTRLERNIQIDDPTIRAFGLVAADPRPRGQELFSYLSTLLHDQNNYLLVRTNAAKALSQTNLPQATKVLAQYTSEMAGVREFLIQMGDIAIPVLAKSATNGESWAINALKSIGTSQAAQALVPLLWHENVNMGYQAAWLLATMITNTNIYATLRNCYISPSQLAEDYYDWIWEPFEPSKQSPARVIVGRIAYLINLSALKPTSVSIRGSVDSRIIIPLCSIELKDNLQSEKINSQTQISIQKEYDELYGAEKHESTENEYKKLSIQDRWVRFVDKNIHHLSFDEKWKFLFRSMALEMQVRLAYRLIVQSRRPTLNDWKNVIHPTVFDFNRSKQAWAIKILWVIISIISALGLGKALSWGGSLTALMSVVLMGFSWIFLNGNGSFYNIWLGFVVCNPIIAAISASLVKNTMISLLISLIIAISSSIFVGLFSEFFYNRIPTLKKVTSIAVFYGLVLVEGIVVSALMGDVIAHSQFIGIVVGGLIIFIIILASNLSDAIGLNPLATSIIVILSLIVILFPKSPVLIILAGSIGGIVISVSGVYNSKKGRTSILHHEYDEDVSVFTISGGIITSVIGAIVGHVASGGDLTDTLVGILIGALIGAMIMDYSVVLIGAIGGAYIVVFVVFSTLLINQQLGWLPTLTFWLVSISWLGFFLIQSYLNWYQSQNPLRGLVNLS